MASEKLFDGSYKDLYVLHFRKAIYIVGQVPVSLDGWAASDAHRRPYLRVL